MKYRSWLIPWFSFDLRNVDLDWIKIEKFEGNYYLLFSKNGSVQSINDFTFDQLKEV